MNVSLGNLSLCPREFQGSRLQWHLLTTTTITIGTANFLFGAVNLFVFSFWENKQTFVVLYWSLSLTEFLFGTTSIFPAINRILDPQRHSYWPFYLSYTTVITFVPLCNYHLIYVCIDRWVSVEFPIFYRNHVSNRFIILVLAATWICIATGNFALVYVLRDYYDVPCASAGVFRYRARWYDIYLEYDYFGLFVTAVITHARMLWIVARSRLQIRRSNVVNAANLGAEVDERTMKKKKLLRTMRKSVLGASIVVVGATLCQMPAKLSQALGLDHTTAFTPMILLLYLEHLIPLVVYWVFYPQYSKTVKDLCVRYGLRKPVPVATGRSTIASTERA